MDWGRGGRGNREIRKGVGRLEALLEGKGVDKVGTDEKKN